MTTHDATEQAYKNGYKTGKRDALKWIPVTERLPGYENVLITNGVDLVKWGYRRPDGVWKYGAESHMRWDRLTVLPVTHWMPLPQPPKEGE